MRTARIFVCAAIAILATGLGLDAGRPSAFGQKPSNSRTMALTFDDLPFVPAGQPYFPGAVIKTMELLDVLDKHHAPAIGFVNEGQLDAGGSRQGSREALLRMWIGTGMTLGNHTYSHPDFNALSIEA